MSNQYFKIVISYDNNLGSTDSEILYAHENNTSDYMKIVTENGENPSMCGTDSYMKCLSHVCNLEEVDSEYFEKVTIEEMAFSKLPNNIQKLF